MWGQLDQHIPVGESVVGLKNSLAQAKNENWTIITLPRANHDLGISETGALHSGWRGYAPGALKTMTDWAWRAIDHPAEFDKMKQEGVAPDAGVLARLAGYENCDGMATAQSRQHSGFSSSSAFLPTRSQASAAGCRASPAVSKARLYEHPTGS
jgi:hypothetical protein